MTLPDLATSTLFDLAPDRSGIDWTDLLGRFEQPWQALGETLGGWLLDHLDGEIEGLVHDGAVVEGEVRIGRGSIVEPGAFVRGPAWIGRDVVVRHGAYVRGNVIVGDEAVVGHATEVKGSIFLPGARAGHFAYVGDSILGRDVNLGAGTKLANLRLDGEETCVRLPSGELVRTGLRKLGAILGDGAQTGCNSVTNPGTVLGRGAVVHPCVVASGYHPAGAVVR